ncbi:CMRF35-like molecule 2 [Hemibagrus wyckioides]|uniref:CMRF35-like molecule 2 n=1 Tax=Hemibagrus wyckioides TaxID=337641 RepID=UPI00266C4446|nr:CMRF35-like molecule 2 [Hemibagrus wyckioides]
MKILLIFTLCLISDGRASKQVTGSSGGGVLIKCKYGTKVRESPKYFCKGPKRDCSEQIKTAVKNEWVNSGRFSLFDNTTSAEFWVMIRALTVQDTGTYHCGVYISNRNDIHTSVELKVNEGFPASTVITVSVILLLLLIGIIILILTLQNRCKMRAGTDIIGLRSVQNSGNDQGVPLDVHEYEEIKDTTCLSASNTKIFTVYATAQLPTIPSVHHTAYAKMELPTNPSDSAVYSTAQRPTIPSDQNIYYKAQLPTNLSA